MKKLILTTLAVCGLAALVPLKANAHDYCYSSHHHHHHHNYYSSYYEPRSRVVYEDNYDYYPRHRHYSYDDNYYQPRYYSRPRVGLSFSFGR